MKRKASIIIAMILPLMVMSQGVITRQGKKPTKTVNKQNGSSGKKSPKSARQTTRTINGHDWVDLGLSVKWATCNVGAFSSSDYGNYYSWGEIKIKPSYTDDNSKTYNTTMGDISSCPQYDAARATWNSPWRLPTKAECQELVEKCIWSWTSKDGHNGYQVTSKINGNSIFIPAAGRRIWTSKDNSEVGGYYLSSTPDENNESRFYSLNINSTEYSVVFCSRDYGYSVRPVSE